MAKSSHDERKKTKSFKSALKKTEKELKSLLDLKCDEKAQFLKENSDLKTEILDLKAEVERQVNKSKSE